MFRTMLPSKFIFGVLFIRQIAFGSTVNSPAPPTSNPPNLSIIIQTTLTNAAINSTSMYPIDIEMISKEMVSGFKDVQSFTIKLLELSEVPTLNAENLLNLLSMVHDTFDSTIATARGLEHKLNGIVGVIDLPMINVQVALQTLIQTIAVNIIITDGHTRDTAQNDINYSLLGVVDGIQLLLDTSYRLLSGIVTLPGNDLAKAMSCLEGIVQTILSITENVLHSLREFLLHFKIESSNGYIMPKLDVELTNALNKLASNVSHPVTSIVKESLEPTLLSIIAKLKPDLDSVAESSLILIQNISHPINELLATITDSHQKVLATRTLTTIPSVTRTLPSSMQSISNEIESLPGNTIGIQSTFNVALSNTIGSFHSLASYLTHITSYGFAATTKVFAVANTQKFLSDTQIVLLLLATNIQTLIDTAIQAISQSLIQTVQSKRLHQMDDERKNALKGSIMKMSLLIENIVKVHMRAMQTLLIGVSQGLKNVLTDYSASIVVVAVNIKHSLGDLRNVFDDMMMGSIGNVSKYPSRSGLNDAIRGFKMVVDNLDNFRINVRNTLRAMERFL